MEFKNNIDNKSIIMDSSPIKLLGGTYFFPIERAHDPVNRLKLPTYDDTGKPYTIDNVQLHHGTMILIKKQLFRLGDTKPEIKMLDCVLPNIKPNGTIILKKGSLYVTNIGKGLVKPLSISQTFVLENGSIIKLPQGTNVMLDDVTMILGCETTAIIL
jgi:hypothetical protein